jgi:hypothetical protein
VVHEIPILDGPESYLTAPFIHLNYQSLQEILDKQRRYLPLEAARWRMQFGRPRLRSVVGQPVREMFRRYVALRGYQDGWRGLVLALVMAWYAGRAVWLAGQARDS